MNSPEVLGSGEDKLNPLEVISKIYESLNIYFKLLRPNEEYDDYKTEAINKMVNGYSADKMRDDLFPNYLSLHGKGNDVLSILFSTAYCIEAEREIENGDNEKAWVFIEKSKYSLIQRVLISLLMKS